LKGPVTPASVTAAMKAMKTSVLPVSGGRVFRCSGKASAAGPAVCAVSTITGSLDANGMPTDYAVANNGPIPG
jgi:branched-chain amino acid transport system substrate-binding protein